MPGFGAIGSTTIGGFSADTGADTVLNLSGVSSSAITGTAVISIPRDAIGSAAVSGIGSVITIIGATSALTGAASVTALRRPVFNPNKRLVGTPFVSSRGSPVVDTGANVVGFFSASGAGVISADVNFAVPGIGSTSDLSGIIPIAGTIRQLTGFQSSAVNNSAGSTALTVALVGSSTSTATGSITTIQGYQVAISGITATASLSPITAQASTSLAGQSDQTDVGTVSPIIGASRGISGSAVLFGATPVAVSSNVSISSGISQILLGSITSAVGVVSSLSGVQTQSASGGLSKDASANASGILTAPLSGDVHAALGFLAALSSPSAGVLGFGTPLIASSIPAVGLQAVPLAGTVLATVGTTIPVSGIVSSISAGIAVSDAAKSVSGFLVTSGLSNLDTPKNIALIGSESSASPGTVLRGISFTLSSTPVSSGLGSISSGVTAHTSGEQSFVFAGFSNGLLAFGLSGAPASNTGIGAITAITGDGTSLTGEPSELSLSGIPLLLSNVALSGGNVAASAGSVSPLGGSAAAVSGSGSPALSGSANASLSTAVSGGGAAASASISISGITVPLSGGRSVLSQGSATAGIEAVPIGLAINAVGAVPIPEMGHNLTGLLFFGQDKIVLVDHRMGLQYQVMPTESGFIEGYSPDVTWNLVGDESLSGTGRYTVSSDRALIGGEAAGDVGEVTVRLPSISGEDIFAQLAGMSWGSDRPVYGQQIEASSGRVTVLKTSDRDAITWVIAPSKGQTVIREHKSGTIIRTRKYN